MNRNSKVKYVCLFLAVVMMLASGLLALACGPAPAAAPATTPATKPPASTPAPTAPAVSPTATPTATPATAQPKTGGILKFWLLGTPAGFDSHLKPTYGPIITIPIFNNIVRFNPTTSGLGTDQIIGDLASKWEWSADGKVVTFTLQKGVTWHDGKPFTADDVVYSFEKMMDPKRSGVSGNFPTYDRTEKVDDFTVRVYLKAPSPSYLLQLAHGYCPIEAKHTAGVDGKSTSFLMGTGPFKFSKAASGVSYEFVKNPNYFRKDAAGRQLPYLDGIIINIMPDRNASASAVATGRLDMSSPITGVATLEIYNQLKNLNKDLVYTTSTNSYGSMWFFNVETPGPLQDIRVRKALTLLCDAKEQVITAYGDTMFCNPENGFMPQTYALPTSEIATILGRDLPYDQRVAQAKKLMADAGYASGFKTSILSRNMQESLRVCQLMADNFKKYLNIDTEIVSKDTGEYAKALAAKQFQIAGNQPVSMLGEPNDLIPIFLSGDPANFTGYKNPAADKLWTEQSTLLDTTKRKAITQQIEKLILSDYLMAPQGFLRTTTVMQPYVKGYVSRDAAYCSNFAYEVVWLDK